MPELPEVQTVVSQLGRKVTGHKIIEFWSDSEKNLKVPKRKLKSRILGAKIIGTRRFGKHIIIDLDNGLAILIHLKMTGHLLVKTKKNRNDKAFTEDPMNRFIHHIFTLDQGATIEFSDMRKFGWIDVAESHQVKAVPSIERLGKDALSKEMDLEHFSGLIQKAKHKKIGTLLLEQEKIAGIGNIYRSEMLYRAGILPFRLSSSLSKSKKEREKLFESMKTVLREAVKLRGTTDGDFRDTAGQPGSFQKTLFVYGRQGKECKKCDTIIERKKLGQRSVFFCSKCQK